MDIQEEYEVNMKQNDEPMGRIQFSQDTFSWTDLTHAVPLQVSVWVMQKM